MILRPQKPDSPDFSAAEMSLQLLAVRPEERIIGWESV